MNHSVQKRPKQNVSEQSTEKSIGKQLAFAQEILVEISASFAQQQQPKNAGSHKVEGESVQRIKSKYSGRATRQGRHRCPAIFELSIVVSNGLLRKGDDFVLVVGLFVVFGGHCGLRKVRAEWEKCEVYFVYTINVRNGPNDLFFAINRTVEDEMYAMEENEWQTSCLKHVNRDVQASKLNAHAYVWFLKTKHI